jgi:hypothetical protein
MIIKEVVPSEHMQALHRRQGDKILIPTAEDNQVVGSE